MIPPWMIAVTIGLIIWAALPDRTDPNPPGTTFDMMGDVEVDEFKEIQFKDTDEYKRYRFDVEVSTENGK